MWFSAQEVPVCSLVLLSGVGFVCFFQHGGKSKSKVEARLKMMLIE